MENGMTIKMIAIDIDGTLLNSAGIVTPATITAVQAAVAQGIKVVLCSGRPLVGVTPHLETLGLLGDATQYVVTFNGAVTTTADGVIQREYRLDRSVYEAATTFAQEHEVPHFVLDPEGRVITADYDVDATAVVQAWENHAGIFVRQPDEMPADFELAKVVFCGDADRLDAVTPAVEKTFGETHYVVRADTHFLEVMNAQASKGQALTMLLTQLGIMPDELMAIGDGMNDLPMFALAGTAVAMGNASETVKSAATHVTKTNDEDGVAAAIQGIMSI